MRSIWLILAFSLVITLANGLGVPGGWNDVTLSPKNEAVVFMVNEINRSYRNNADNGFRTLNRVLKARSQVVNGINYEITLELTTKKTKYTCTALIGSQLGVPKNQRFKLQAVPKCSPKN